MGEANRSERGLPCDYCVEAAALLYCPADAARLCLLCDRHVHAANALARKHVRSLACDNCGAQAAAGRCAADGLALCPDCDWDAHGGGGSVAHPRTLLEGFSGCPSALDLAASWGIDLAAKEVASPHRSAADHLFFNSSSLDSFLTRDRGTRDLYVPCATEITTGQKRLKSLSGKQALFQQLTELSKQDSATASTTCRTETGGNKEDRGLSQPIPYTSLLVMAPSGCAEMNRLVEEEDLRWDCGPTDRSTQV